LQVAPGRALVEVPITAYEAQSGTVLRVLNRPGNIHDGKASLPFLKDLFDQIDPGDPGRGSTPR
jgi:hypothetical protein